MIMRMKTGLLQSIIKKVIVILPFYLFTFLPNRTDFHPAHTEDYGW